uniref:ATP synthase F0 subunit 8 n=1 Tax=Cellana orientalis TaxID=351212 RepID=UPI0020294E1E|nr:ATP synthase F0 subunit 8 [Cellana orientalis]UPX89387.1 ATP synthase F0 subunit 8 [Cellana orientalis]
MPQLGPVNWLFVYFFFWFVVILFSVVFWWMKGNYFYLNLSGKEGESFNRNKVPGKSVMIWKW